MTSHNMGAGGQNVDYNIWEVLAKSTTSKIEPIYIIIHLYINVVLMYLVLSPISFKHESFYLFINIHKKLSWHDLSWI